MIITLNDKKDAIVSTALVPKEGKKKEIEYLHQLYSHPDVSLGYLQGGMLWWHNIRPNNDFEIEDDIIYVEETHLYQPKNCRFPVRHYYTKARNTLIVIRKILESPYGRAINMKDFFNIDRRPPYEPLEYDEQMRIKIIETNIDMQIKKLEYLLENEELALLLLRDVNLDFYLFVDLLTRVELETEILHQDAFEYVKDVAEDNSKVLTIAKEFAKLKP